MRPHCHKRSKAALLKKAIWIHTWLLLGWAIAQQNIEVSAVSADPLPSERGAWSAGEEVERIEDPDDHRAAWPAGEEVERIEDPDPSESSWDEEEEDDDVIVIATVDGTLAGLSKATGKTLWKQQGSSDMADDSAAKDMETREEQMRPQPGKEKPKQRDDYSRSRLLSPLLSTSTTTKSGDWKTAAVPSVDGRVYLTAGRESSWAPKAELASNAIVSDLVSRAPFVDGRGRFYVGSSHATAAALDRDTGEILRVVSGEDVLYQEDLSGRNIVFLGRVDHSVSMYDARTGVKDVQFSTSEIKGANDMMAGGCFEREKQAWDADPSQPQRYVPRIALPDGDVDADDPFQPPAKPSLLVATPNGNLALRDPETGAIQWVAGETFDSPVAFAVESSSGKSLGVDIIPDTPVPSSSPEYISNQLERQMGVLNNESVEQDGDKTIVGALTSGQLFAMPLGNKQGTKTRRTLSLPQPHSVAAVGSAKQLHDSNSFMGRAHSQNVQDVSSHSNAGADHKKHGKKPCSPSNPAFPGCLVGNIYRGDQPLGITGGNYGHQHHQGRPIPADMAMDEYGAVTIHYHPQLGYMANEDQVHDLLNRKTSRSFLRIMASWLPPTMALIFVLSFELGRRHRLRKEAPETNGSLENVNEQVSSGKGDGAMGNVGVIQLTDEVLGYGGHGTMVYKGTLDGRKVAVKRMLKTYHASADREISLLIESDGHPNVVRYFLKEARGDFVYLALELCDFSLHDMICLLGTARSQIETKQPCVSESVKSTLLQIASGVRHLHSLRIVHRDLKPANILLALTSGAGDAESDDQSVIAKFERGEYVAKISDMGLGKQLTGQSSFGMSTLGNASIGHPAPSNGSLVGAGPGSVGWQAPEVMAVRLCTMSTSLPSDSSSRGGQESVGEASPMEMAVNARTSRSVDIFSLGCIFYCTLIPGSHPFGEWYEREANIMRNRPSTEALKNLSEDAYDLVTAMINRDANARPTAKQVCCHPFFWNRQQRLSFLCDISDRLEADAGQSTAESGSLALVGNSLAIERNAAQVVGIAWDKDLDPDLINNVSRFRTYDPSSVRDCLRLIRNKHHHYDELPAEVKARMGSNPDGLQQYFEERFPNLLMHCYSVFRDLMAPDDPLAAKYMISPITKQLRRKESQASTVSDNTTSVTPIVDNVQLSLPAPSPVCDDIVDDESNDGASSVDEDLDEYSLVNEVSPAAVDAQDACALVENEQNHDPNDSTAVAAMPVEDSFAGQAEPSLCNTNDIVAWEGSTAAKSFACRGWIRSDDEWVRRTDASLRKRDSNVARCADDPKFRTRLCNHWDVSQGTFCPMKRKNKCVFAHGPVELRVKEGKRHRWGKLVDKNGDNANPNHSGGEDTYGAARSIETVRKEEGKWNTNKVKGKGKQQAAKKK